MIRNSKQQIAFRVDATPQIALGHLKRCISLAEALRSIEIESYFISFSDTTACKILSSSSFDYFFVNSEINSKDDLSETLHIINGIGSRVIILDSYDIDAKYINDLSKFGQITVCIDDIADRYLPCHLLINGSLGAEKLLYGNNMTKYLLGIQYSILSKSFWNTEVKIPESIQNILITMGGIDHFNLSVRSLKILEKVDAEFSITLIIGPYYENIKEIEEQVGRMKKTVTLVRDEGNLYKYMQECDLAISAGGRTLYELAALGRPIIGLSLAKNQSYNVNELNDRKVVYGLTYYNESSFDKELEKAILYLFQNHSIRKKLANNACKMFDGNGSLRVANKIDLLMKEI